MTDTGTSPYEAEPPSGKRLLVTTGASIAAAAIVLVAVVLPAEYGVDPTGIGGALGLTALSAATETIEITDVIGGNERVREAEIPDFGKPVPLPNPNVYQGGKVKTETFEITIPPEQETEIKTVLEAGKMIMFSWKVDRGDVYVDFHGHDPALGQDFWVRYEEQQEGEASDGALVAPFAGEHGWYWLNYNEFPVTISLTVTGLYEEVIDYGIF